MVAVCFTSAFREEPLLLCFYSRNLDKIVLFPLAQAGSPLTLPWFVLAVNMFTAIWNAPDLQPEAPQHCVRHAWVYKIDQAHLLLRC